MRRFFAIMIIITVGLFGKLHAEINDNSSVPKSQCGINSLYFCLKYFGCNRPFHELYNDIATNSNNEVNLKQLADYARQKGLFVNGVKSPTLSVVTKNLEKGKCVILQWTKSIGNTQFSHIMPIVNIPDKGVLVFDFPINKMYVSEKDLSEYIRLSNAALILAAEERVSFFQNDVIKFGIGIFVACSFGLIIIFYVYKNTFLKERKA